VVAEAGGGGGGGGGGGALGIVKSKDCESLPQSVSTQNVTVNITPGSNAGLEAVLVNTKNSPSPSAKSSDALFPTVS
jgi:hypothetical protein